LKRVVAGSVTTLILAALLIAAAIRSRDAVAESPDRCLDRMYEAMKSGDVAAYLDCFTGELRERLDRDADEQSTPAFANYLRELASPIKGRALRSDQTQQLDSDHVRLVVDRVYDGRPWELQAYRLRPDAGRWKIYEIEPAELHEPPVPYGTPAFSTSDEPSGEPDATKRGS
jgi:hypothetical protein